MAGDEHLSKRCKFVQAVTLTSGGSGSSGITGLTIDMQDFESICFLVAFGAIAPGATTSIKVQRGDAANMSDAADIAGSNQTISDTADDTFFYVDIIRPKERYVRLMVARAVGNATVGAIGILYDSHFLPAIQGAGVSGEAFVDAAEGTA